MRWARRLIYWLRFRSRERDLEDELSLHRELLTEDLERRGVPATAAGAVARKAMGNVTYMREEARAVWRRARRRTRAGTRIKWREGYNSVRIGNVITCAGAGAIVAGRGEIELWLADEPDQHLRRQHENRFVAADRQRALGSG